MLVEKREREWGGRTTARKEDLFPRNLGLATVEQHEEKIGR
jgi:hypothetical protein